MKMLDIVNIPMEKIFENPSQPRETFEKEEIDQMGISIKKIGLMNPITVRPYKGGYEIIAGARRYRAAKNLGEKEIQAKIVDADDIEAAIMGIAENYHRKDLAPAEREKAIYAAWKKGRTTIFKDKVSIMSKWTGIPLSTLTEIINACKEKDASKSKIIQNATAKDLSRTRDLEGIAPDIREELLKLKQSNIVTGEGPKLRQPKPIIGAMDLDNIVKAIKIAKNADVTDEIIKDIPRLISTNKISPAKVEDFIKLVIEAPKGIQKDIVEYVDKENITEFDKMRTFIDQLKQYPHDIQEKLLKKEIDLEDAKLASNLQTVEQRERLLNERRTMAEDNIKEIQNFINRNRGYDYYLNKYEYLQDYFIFEHYQFKKLIEEDKRFGDVSAEEYIKLHDESIIGKLDKKIDIFKKDKNKRINTDILKNVGPSETAIVFLFGTLWKELSQKLGIIHIDDINVDIFPDMIVSRKGSDGSIKKVSIEFEVISSNFLRHKHPVDRCNIIICWKHDWIDCPGNIEVIELCKMKNENNLNDLFQMNDNSK